MKSVEVEIHQSHLKMRSWI